ncbi:MAG TPA: lysylphosphatidylglycerol synthase transmembrane domain-containing protein, partial [Sedimentisphaerales bacterium]|nr:lysylphosphatidylglycerol synthase transmembrane domain-containing protein [Sedimentisphaerales bacterium]
MPSDAGSKKKTLSLIARFLVAGVVLYFVFRGQDWAELRKTFASLNLWVFAASAGIFVICQLIVSFRWWLLLRTQSVRIDLWPAVRLNFLGLFYNNFLPSAVGGDLIRAWYVTRHTDRRVEAALSVFVDRIIGLICIAIMAFVAWWVLFGWMPLDLGQGYVVRAGRLIGEEQQIGKWLVLALLILAVAAFLIAPIRIRLIAAGRKVLYYVRRIYQRGFGAARLYLKNPWTLLATVFLTLCSQTIVVVGFWLVGNSMGIDAPFRYYIVFFPLSWVLGTLPISLAGAGIVE